MSNDTFDQADEPGAVKGLPFDREQAVRIARLYPRDTRAALRRLLKRAKDPTWATLATYPVERDGDTFYRPSVNMARPVAEELGDITTGFRIVGRGGDYEQLEGWAFDASTRREDSTQEALCLLVEERGKPPRRMTEKEARAARNSLGAILVRNALLHVLPHEFVDKLLAACRNTIELDAEQRVEIDAQAAASETMRLILEAGGTREQVERFIGHPLEQYTKQDELALRGILRRVEEGIGTIASVFEAVEAAESSFAPEAEPPREQPDHSDVPTRTGPILPTTPNEPLDVSDAAFA